MEKEALKEFIDFVIQERMQKAFSRMKEGKDPGRSDEIERNYQEAVAMLPLEQEKAVREYCDSIFDSGAESEEFFYRLGLRDGIHLKKTVKQMIKSVS